MGGIDIDIAVCSTRSKDSWTGECQARFDIRSGGEKAYEQRQATWHLIVGADVVEAVMVHRSGCLRSKVPYLHHGQELHNFFGRPKKIFGRPKIIFGRR